ncbi:hypothetical protein BC830DRAFT_1134634 [Chytriomyces sp. MP71]|nr:hypothetical protein BC830DRAFT_1134634 [Chytriomyces sp. MP71]
MELTVATASVLGACVAILAFGLALVLLYFVCARRRKRSAESVPESGVTAAAQMPASMDESRLPLERISTVGSSSSSANTTEHRASLSGHQTHPSTPTPTPTQSQFVVAKKEFTHHHRLIRRADSVSSLTSSVFGSSRLDRTPRRKPTSDAATPTPTPSDPRDSWETASFEAHSHASSQLPRPMGLLNRGNSAQTSAAMLSASVAFNMEDPVKNSFGAGIENDASRATFRFQSGTDLDSITSSHDGKASDLSSLTSL